MFAVVGENIIDLVPGEGAGTYVAHAGGSPANVAVAATRLGSPTALVGRVSRDVFGTRIRERLADAGVDDRYLVSGREASALAVVTFDEQRRASYDFWLDGAVDWQWRADELPDPLADDVSVVHVGSLAVFLEPGASAIEQFLIREGYRGRVTLSLDPNVRPTIVSGADGSLDEARARVERLVGLVDVVKASDEDLGWIYPGVPAEEAAAGWLDRGPALVVVTRGEEGATAVGRRATVTVRAPDVEVVDTVGAGDTFAGALLDGLGRAGLLGPGGGERIAALDEAALATLARRAATAAALTCTRAGADPPTAEELDAALARP